MLDGYFGIDAESVAWMGTLASKVKMGPLDDMGEMAQSIGDIPRRFPVTVMQDRYAGIQYSGNKRNTTK